MALRAAKSDEDVLEGGLRSCSALIDGLRTKQA